MMRQPSWGALSLPSGSLEGSLGLHAVSRSVTDIFLESGKKSKDFHKYENCLQNNYLKKFIGVGWGITVMFSFQIICNGTDGL